MLRVHNILIVGFLLLNAFSSLASVEVLDRIVAVVNRQIITLSDVQRERKFLEIEPGNPAVEQGSSGTEVQTQSDLTQRLIEQSLIRQQIQSFPGIDVSSEEVEGQIVSLKKKTNGSSLSWEQQVKQLGLEPEEVREHLRWQLQVTKFFDSRFRQFAVVDEREIEGYYRDKFLPELAVRGIERHPPLPEVEEKIRAILTEEKVNLQIDDWLKSLRESASVEVFD
jgi:parvulin-like peptidyl-prolyl isomerase